MWTVEPFYPSFCVRWSPKAQTPHLNAQTTCRKTLKQLVLLGAHGDKMYPMNERLRWRRRRAAGRHAPRMDTAGRNGRSGDSRTMLEIFDAAMGVNASKFEEFLLSAHWTKDAAFALLCLSVEGGGRARFCPRRFSRRMLMILESRVRS